MVWLLWGYSSRIGKLLLVIGGAVYSGTSSRALWRFVEGSLGTVLGVMPGLSFERVELALEPGATLVLYTDGVTEAEDPRDREFGEARLEAWLQANREETGQRLIDGVTAEVLEHCGAARPRDDMTLMCLDSRGVVTVPSS